MDRSEAVSERNRNDVAPAIYEADNRRASNALAETRWTRALIGFVFGAACWMIGCQFGVPNILGIGTTGGEIPAGVVGALVAQTRLYRAVIWITVSLLILLGIVSFTSVSPYLVRPLIRVDAMPKDADAVVVLSGGVTNDGYLPQQGSDRVRKALELMNAHVAPVLVVTRERKGQGRGVNSADDQDAFIGLAGVDSVIHSGWVTSTRAEAEQVSRIVAANHWKRVIVVTSPVHSRRACATFESLGMKVSCIPSDSRDVSLNRMTSAHDRVGAFALWLYELAGTLRYRQLGYL